MVHNSELLFASLLHSKDLICPSVIVIPFFLISNVIQSKTAGELLR